MAEDSFLAFKAYAQFLLDEKLAEAATENLRIVRDLNLPLLRLFAHLPEAELLALVGQSLEQFLRQITLGQAWKAATASIVEWKANQLPGVPREKVEASDIVLSYSARKQLFVSFLPAYTQDVRLITDLLLELERFYLRLEQESLRVYEQIQQQELRSANDRLRESQEELQAANEELQAINEEYHTTNEQLLDQIHKREAAEESLRQSERRFRLLAQNATDVISTHDLEGAFTYVSPSVESMLGYTPKELTGQTAYGFFHPDDLERIIKKHRQILDHDPGSGVYAFRFRHRQGGYVWLESSVKAIRDSQTGRIVEIQVGSRNVTRRRQAEEELEQERQYLKVILETISDGIAACRADGILSYFNPATRELHGLPQQMLPPEQWAQHYSLLHPDGRLMEPEEVPLLRALRGETVRGAEMMIISARGGRRTLLTSGNRFLSAEGEVMGAVVSMHDVTEQKEAEQALVNLNRELQEKIAELLRAREQLRELNGALEGRVQARTAALKKKNEELEKTNADLDNFIYIISHDLKTPIVNLEGLVAELRHELAGKTEEETLALLGMVEASTARFKKTLQDLAQIIRFQQEREPVEEHLSFKTVLEEVKATLGPAIVASAAAFEEQLAEDTVWFDRKSLVSLLQNLLSNALKYRSPNRQSKITVSTSAEGSFTLLEVRDNGLGLTPEQQAKVFDLFRRFHPHVEGSGMGLYIVKKIMERHQGKVAVESEKGEYTCFKLYFNQKQIG